MTDEDLSVFVASYVEAMLFSTNDESDESGGKPLDRNYTAGDFTPAAMLRIRVDCRKFLRANEADIRSATRPYARFDYSAIENAGHDFWFSRMGHGCGFWDGDWSEPEATRLTAAAKVFGGDTGEAAPMVGDDGKLHLGNDRALEVGDRVRLKPGLGGYGTKFVITKLGPWFEKPRTRGKKRINYDRLVYGAHGTPVDESKLDLVDE